MKQAIDTDTKHIHSVSYSGHHTVPRNGTNKLPEAIGTIKLPERQIIGSSYTSAATYSQMNGRGDKARTCIQATYTFKLEAKEWRGNNNIGRRRGGGGGGSGRGGGGWCLLLVVEEEEKAH